MSDGGDFDPCECVCSTQWAMRRLLSILRTSQQYCTDNECQTTMPGSGGGPESNTAAFFMFVLWVFVLIFLFIQRPASLRNTPGAHKGTDSDREDRYQPPDVPPVQ